MNFNVIEVSGDIKDKITQIVNFRCLAVGLVVAALIVTVGFGGFGDICHYVMDCCLGDTYWVTESTGKIHRRGCMYYRAAKGGETRHPVGTNCLVCGGKKDNMK